MSTKDWFGIAVRVLGIWGLIHAIRQFVYFAAQLNGWTRGEDSNPRYMVFYVAADFAVAIFMMRGAHWIVEFCYPTFTPPADPSIDDAAKPPLASG